MNPLREPREDSPAKKLGRAYHKLLLEGDAAFDDTYAVAPSLEDHPNALDTMDELRKECRRLGLPVSGNKAELCERLHEADPVLILWSDIMADFEAISEGKEILTKAQWKEIQQVRYVLNHMPEIKSAFNGGYPEVSILWTESGVPMKARLDYLKPRGNAVAVLDLKSFGNIMGLPIEIIPQTEIGRRDYFIQPVTYSAAIIAARSMWAQHGMEIVQTVSGDEPPYAWLQSVLASEKPHPQFHFVFVRTGGIPDMIAAEFMPGEAFGGLGYQSFEYWNKGLAIFRNGLARYKRCMAEYGPDVPWINNYGIKKLKDEDFRPWTLDYSTELIDSEAA